MPRLFATAALLTVTGCASVTGSKLQSISILSVQDSKEVAGAGCTLSNDAGKWVVTTPGSVTVAKSTGDLSVECKKDAGVVGQATVASKANKAVWANILLGGPGGYVIDRQTGAGFDYPPSITVLLNQTLDALIVPPPVKKAAEVPSPPPPVAVLPPPVEKPAQAMPVLPPPSISPSPSPVPPLAEAASAPLAPPANQTFDVPMPPPSPLVVRRKKADSYWE